jgi:hypothetical protein
MIRALHSFWVRGSRVERAGYVVGALLLLSGLVHLGLLIGGASSWDGPLSLRKPMSFGLSFGLTVVTFIWVASFLPLSTSRRSLLLAAFTLASVLETGLVSMQAWRGVPSHFNVATSFDARITQLLAAGGATLVALIAVVTWVAFRVNPGVPPSMRLAIRIGLVALLAAQIVGGAMIARGMTLVFSGDPSAAYVTGGLYKPTHAVTMHGVLVLPALAWMLSFVEWPEGRRVSLVRLAAAGYLILVGTVAVSNVAGLPAGGLPPLVLQGLMAAGALSLLVCGALAIGGTRGRPRPDGIQHA